MNTLLPTWSFWLVLGFAMSGCFGNHSGSTLEEFRYDLAVENVGERTVFVEVTTGDRTENFGVLSPGSLKVIGFGSGSTGQDVTIRWKVDEGDTRLRDLVQHVVTLNMPTPTRNRVTLYYLRDGTWATKVPPEKTAR